MAVALAAPAVSPCRRHSGQARVRLTRRARVLLLLLLAASVVVLAPWRAIASSPQGQAPQGWSTVMVQPGDTLWTLAESVDAEADPRIVVAEIKTANGLQTSQLRPGQMLSIPPAHG